MARTKAQVEVDKKRTAAEKEKKRISRIRRLSGKREGLS
jgi:hypothetical protein